MTRYASQTTVAPERSRAEIEKTLVRYGADGFMYGWEENGAATVGFKAHNRIVKFVLPMPNRQEFELTETGQVRSESAMQSAYDKAVRQRWRAMALVVKAKLEAVETGIVTFEDEFMAHIIIPGTGETVGQWMKPQIQLAYDKGDMPRLLEPPRG